MVVFLAPGWLLCSVLRTPIPLVSAFLASCALAFNLVLLLGALGIPLGLTSVGCGFLAATGLLALWAQRRAAFRTRSLQPPERPRGSDWMWLLPPTLALASIVARGLVDPLSGYDNSFRWDYLARMILDRQSLGAYPPVTGADFNAYSWPDGIPPLVPILNFLIYAVAGSVSPRLIALRSAGEFLLLCSVVHAFSRGLWGKSAGWAALAVLGSCALLSWGVAIEQETALTALGLTSMVYLIEVAPPEGEDGDPRMLWAGVAAGIGAISREYGLYFVILGLALAWVRRRPAAGFLAAAVAIAAPWYLRNWVRTGNPVYPALGRIFPTNAVYNEIMADIASFWGFRNPPMPIVVLPEVLAATAALLVVLGAIGAVRLGRRALGAVAAILLVGSLCVWAMPLTAGGWIYGMRVLVPALALGAALGGWVANLGAAARFAVALLAAGISVDAARRAWLLPDFPFSTPWSASFADWRRAHPAGEGRVRGTMWETLVKVAAGRSILVDSPLPHVAINRLGGSATPLMSPQVAPAFDASLTVEEAVARLRALHVRFVTFSIRNPFVVELVRRHGTLRKLVEDYAPVADINGMLVFDLEFLQRRPAPATEHPKP